MTRHHGYAVLCPHVSQWGHPLPPFESVAVCLKCNAPRKSTSTITGYREAEVRYVYALPGIPVSPDHPGLAPSDEHLVIACWRCGYSWHKQPARAPSVRPKGAPHDVRP